MLGDIDGRRITLVHNAVGNIGKSTFAEDVAYNVVAADVPPFQRLEDLIQVFQAARNKKAFIADMPRSMPQVNVEEFSAGAESELPPSTKGR